MSSVDRAGDAEIDDSYAVLRKVAVSQDIGRLDVAVHDSAVVDVIQGVGDLGQRGQPIRQRPEDGARSRRRDSSIANQPGPRS